MSNQDLKIGNHVSRHLDVGCGSKPRNPFRCSELYGVDIIEQQPVDFHYTRCNVLLEKIPFDDSTFDSVSCYDFIEHIPRLSIGPLSTRFHFVEFMNEVYRVLRPGGKFYALTPYFPRPEAFVDPTHVNIITKDTHKYFTAPDYSAAVYGFVGKFRVVRVKKTKLSWEEKHLGGRISLVDHLYHTLVFAKKSHLLWEFEAQ